MIVQNLSKINLRLVGGISIKGGTDSLFFIEDPGILNEEERVCSFFDADPTNQSEVDLAQVLDNHVDDPVVVNVCLPCIPRFAIHLDVMNGVAQNLLLLLPLDPRRPGVLDRILHDALHLLVVVQQNNSVRLAWSNTNHLSCWTFTGDLPEEESPRCKSIPHEIRANLEVVAHLVQLLQNSNAKQLSQRGRFLPIASYKEQGRH